MDPLEQLQQNRAFSRRNFLGAAGSLAAASALTACGSSSNGLVTAPVTTTTAAYTDTDILNFALNLEYLEAEFYLRAATGSGLASADAGSSPGAVTGGAMVTGPLSSAQQNIINEIAFDEQQHVRFLRSALGSSAVARPAIDLTAPSTLLPVRPASAAASILFLASTHSSSARSSSKT